MGQTITQRGNGWLEQQEAIRIGFIRGFLKDLSLLNYYPEYRSAFFNETVLNAEIMHQYKALQNIRMELKRREIP